jgi:hypothetical protein
MHARSPFLFIFIIETYLKTVALQHKETDFQGAV